MNELVKIKMHGIFGENIGKEFNLAVSSVPEALHAINVLTNGGWQRMLLSSHDNSLKYSIVVNEKPLDLSHFSHINKENINDPKNKELIKNSEIFLNQKGDLRSIDIVPVSEGGDATFFIYVLVVIITTVITLALMKPPKFDDFREIEDTRKGQSYLFSGPSNTVNEGGPIPLGYGRALVGSQVVAQTFHVYYENADGSSANVSSAERVAQSDSSDKMGAQVKNFDDLTKTAGEMFGVLSIDKTGI